MSSIAAAGFPSRSHPDRNAFLFFTGMVWVGVLSGFGTDSFNHVREHGLDYPLIVHFHAVVFVGYLVLFTTQVLLIRSGHPDIHRRLGVAGAVLAVVMIILGPATAIVVDTHAYAISGTTPEFLAIQFTGIFAFAVLTSGGLLLRRNSPVHKRLMLLGLIFISSAGFTRFLNPLLTAPLGHAFWGRLATTYLASDLLMLGLGAYDLVTRRKLYPAYIAAVVFSGMLEFNAYTLLSNPGWKALTMHLIGH